MDNHSSIEVHAIFHGRVQGVGFRYITQRYAMQLKLSGTVRNLSDGSVELYAVGMKKDLDQLIQHLRENVGAVDSVDVEYSPKDHLFVGFQII